MDWMKFVQHYEWVIGSAGVCESIMKAPLIMALLTMGSPKLTLPLS